MGNAAARERGQILEEAMKSLFGAAGLLLGVGLIVRADPPAGSSEDLKREVSEAVRAAKDYTYQQKDEYRKRLDRLAGRLDDRIAELQIKAREAKGEAKTQLDQSVEDLRRRSAVLRKQTER